MRTGWRLTTTAETPAGIPREMAKKTPPRYPRAAAARRPPPARTADGSPYRPNERERQQAEQHPGHQQADAEEGERLGVGQAVLRPHEARAPEEDEQHRPAESLHARRRGGGHDRRPAATPCGQCSEGTGTASARRSTSPGASVDVRRLGWSARRRCGSRRRRSSTWLLGLGACPPDLLRRVPARPPGRLPALPRRVPARLPGRLPAPRRPPRSRRPASRGSPARGSTRARRASRVVAGAPTATRSTARPPTVVGQEHLAAVVEALQQGHRRDVVVHVVGPARPQAHQRQGMGATTSNRSSASPSRPAPAPARRASGCAPAGPRPRTSGARTTA